MGILDVLRPVRPLRGPEQHDPETHEAIKLDWYLGGDLGHRESVNTPRLSLRSADTLESPI